MNPTASDAPLSVTSQTTPPDRFTVSTPTEVKRGTVFLTFAKPAAAPDVTCTEISVSLPCGAAATDLVNDEPRANQTLIDDYPRDSTGASWSIHRLPAAPVATAPEWGEARDHEFANIFDPRDDLYYQTRGLVPKDSSLVVDYGTDQDITDLDIATGMTSGRYKVQMLRLQASMDGLLWQDLDEHPVQDTSRIERSFDPPLHARYLRIHTIVEPSNEGFAIVRRFLVNQGGQTRSEASTVTFVCTPDTTPAVFDDSRDFTLILSNIPINSMPGAAALEIAQTVVTDGGEARHTSTLDGFAKADNAFVFENFSSEQTRVENGGHVTLHWAGSPENTAYYLSWDDRNEPISVPSARDCSYDTANLPDFAGLTRTTTFVLDAQTTNPSGQTVHHYQSTTVTVANPVIEAGSLTATDHITVRNDSGTDTFLARSRDVTTWALTADCEGDVTIS
ncbi:discoidin domain-containing protein [Kitasatospora sp. NPDC056446]|uniref:discoidin domain-containing protein n=1 Tax=Kitasatospora sp. NPDC056446 TaxID=3345819 RepID=UPI00368C46C1